MLKFFQYIKDFNGEYKHTPGQDIKRDALQLVRNIYMANKSQQKAVHLKKFIAPYFTTLTNTEASFK